MIATTSNPATSLISSEISESAIHFPTNFQVHTLNRENWKDLQFLLLLITFNKDNDGNIVYNELHDIVKKPKFYEDFLLTVIEYYHTISRTLYLKDKQYVNVRILELDKLDKNVVKDFYLWVIDNYVKDNQVKKLKCVKHLIEKINNNIIEQKDYSHDAITKYFHKLSYWEGNDVVITDITKYNSMRILLDISCCNYDMFFFLFRMNYLDDKDNVCKKLLSLLTK